jgi:putative PEP-CTERM system TPR-repeat lipoprotein
MTYSTLLRGPHRAAALLALAVTLAACSRSDPSQLLQSARDYQAKDEHAAAVIQLRNAVQKQPDNGEARLLLGQSSLQVGDPVTAEKEFRKAIEYGVPREAVAPQLARALLETGDIDKVVSEFGTVTLADAKGNAELRAVVGDAQLRMRKPADAAASFQQAIAADPSNARAQIGQVRLLAVEGKLPEALAAVAKVVAAQPASIEPLTLQSELQFATGDRAAARASLTRAIEIKPKSIEPRLELVALLITDNDLDGAARELEAARPLKTDDLRVTYFDALVAVGRKDNKKARELSQELLKRAPEHVPTLVLAGGIEFQDKHFATAEGYLQKAVLLAPEHAGARALLARSYLSSNQPARTLDALQPLLARGSRVDAGTLMVAGEAALATGDAKQAVVYFEQAAQSKPQETAARVRLGQLAMARGDYEAGIKTLESAAAQEDAAGPADAALIGGYLRQGDTTKALQAAQELTRKAPTAASYQLLGAVHVVRKELPAARAAYGKALEIDAGYLPAAAGLARLDLADGKPADARGRFEAVLAKNPQNDLALLGLAEVMAATQAPMADVAAVLQKAIAARPESATPRLALITLYLQNKDTRAALSAAQEAAVAHGQDPRVLDALGRAQAAAGESNQALETYRKLAAMDPQSVTPLLRIAGLHVQRQEADKAVDVLQRAQRLAPKDPNVARDLVVGYLMMGKTDEALKQARALQQQLPTSATGFILEGDIYATAKQWGPAERAFRDGLKADPSSTLLVVKLHGVLSASGKKAEADALARKRLQDQPDDFVFRSYLGEQALNARDFRTAATVYQGIVAQQPTNVAALNNLAWALGQLGDPKALGFGERALKLAPQSPLVLDTVGVLLLAQGDSAKAVDLLSRAVAAAPDRPDIRLNYAKALLKAGRKEDARRELTQLEGVKQDFPGKAEVATLLKQ